MVSFCVMGQQYADRCKRFLLTKLRWQWSEEERDKVQDQTKAREKSLVTSKPSAKDATIKGIPPSAPIKDIPPSALISQKVCELDEGHHAPRCGLPKESSLIREDEG
ncbi:hypothetical protein NE237_017027 [Protea cynaroides]|uniref:Uncharacterized protein n=1 Tax=Protea cynaroides TaxID=273540 RepID=A0A9Q0K792_9MAGN|nr:hypothetical protein NE237_017027 [Protea cynaroides]